jgi:uncharacterized protein
MILCDVNVLLYAMVAATPHHELCRRELNRLRRGREQIAVSELVAAAVVRIATHTKVFRPAVAPAEAFAFVDAWSSHPRAVRVEPRERHWSIFRDLVLAAGFRGSDTTDAYLAALAIEHGCEWWTTDSGFGRFPALRSRNLLED